MERVIMTIKKQYFDEILSGEKTSEYRENKAYWHTRLDNVKCPCILELRNGYGHTVPTLEVECTDIFEAEDKDTGETWIELVLGKVLNIKNN
jgi:hypothetical protein